MKNYIVLKYDKSKGEVLNNNKNYEFIGFSRIDSNPIYKVKHNINVIEEGYTIIHSLINLLGKLTAWK